MRIAVSRAPGAERVVTPLELFFDLVYVFAIGQLSHHLLEHVDVRTAAETLIMALAVVYAWYMTAWGANWLEPNRLPVRLLLVGLMFASLLMSVANRRRRRPPRAVGDRRRRHPHRRLVAALAARARPGDRPRAHGDRRRAPHRALPAVLHHRARRDRAHHGRRVRRRAVRARAAARAGDRVHRHRGPLVGATSSAPR
jgi:hypothetical protein